MFTNLIISRMSVSLDFISMKALFIEKVLFTRYPIEQEKIRHGILLKI